MVHTTKMKLLLMYTSALCLAFAKKSSHYEVLRFKRQIDQNHPRSLDNRFKVLQNQRRPLHINSEQLSEYTGAAQHNTHGPLHTDQARDIIHFPQQTKDDTGKDSFELTKAQTERHNHFNKNQLTELYINGMKVNTSQLNELINVVGDVKLAPNKRNSIQMQNIVLPVTKVTRTVYVNGVKVDNDQNVGSIINALLNQHTSSSSPGEDSNKQLNVNQNSNYNQQSNQQIPSFIFNHLNNYKPDSNTGQREYLQENNDFMPIPDIDIRMGGLEQQFGDGKLARLREKGRHVKNATSVPDKQHMHVKTRDLTQFVRYKSLADGIIFL